ncbi:MAG: hypothetical protein LBP59_06960 [Planctomycetaceae bacterium]|jgi:hypothetical protein|nr:hypothetical protein [Planctomycetaceae bacterium]
MIRSKKIITVLIFILFTSNFAVYLYAQNHTEWQGYVLPKPEPVNLTIENANANQYNADGQNKNFYHANNPLNANNNNCNNNSNPYGSSLNFSDLESTKASRPIDRPAPVIANSSTNSLKYFLLKTNYIIEGDAKNDGKNYDIKTSYGKVKIPVNNVAYIGQSRNDVYKYKKAQINPASGADLMKFAEWCASSNFLTEAIVEYENALALTNDNVAADIIRQRINSIKKNMPDSDQSTDNSNLNELYIDSAANSDFMRNDQLKAAKNLTDNFRRYVQPTLIKNCVTADCHTLTTKNGINVTPNKFKLKATQYGKASVNFYQENLNECLAYIDLESPMKSKLLNYVLVPHGRFYPPFNVESEEYIKIVEWVQLAAKNMPLIKSGDLAPLFNTQNADAQIHTSTSTSTSNPNPNSQPYITAGLNSTTPQTKLDNIMRNQITTNLPESFKEVVNIQNQLNNKQSQKYNLTKNHTNSQQNLEHNHKHNFINENRNAVNMDNTDPLIFNKIYHPEIAR